ncbi:MAG: 2,3-bisphosphoglycerate-independent phosphoglycerate mutase [Anaerolineae bacterium]
MNQLELMKELTIKNDTKIVLLVLDGVGGTPMEPGGPTELEAAHTPNLDALAARSSCGMSTAVAPGITPGSGPGHLSLFGYDPLQYEIGRGVLEALGIGFDLQPDDVAARGNFCTVDANGLITDRRAGRISSEEGARRVELLRSIELPGVQTFVEPVKEYRLVLVLRGEGLSGDLDDTDPQQTGVAPLPATARTPAARRTADLVNEWIEKARHILANHPPANMLTLRGFAVDPNLPRFPDIYKLRSAAVAVYPMYKGVARLVGMDVLPVDGDSPADEFETVRQHWDDYDFFFIHIKKTDSAGEDGNFDAKVHVIETVDTALPALLDLEPDVLVVTGDHSTPALLKSHSWHALPILLSARTGRSDRVASFGETACLAGSLGHIRHVDIMPLALAHALRLTKYGA